ncbi:hypothetical protein [Archangium violaceum]|uniref:hypothetical protein n=1 Tax=Archangium violaceum TaxID=83451 RepID=UPI0036DBB228
MVADETPVDGVLQVVREGEHPGHLGARLLDEGFFAYGQAHCEGRTNLLTA